MLANRTATLLIRRQIARGNAVASGQSFSSASAVMDDAPSPPSNNVDTSKPPHNVYMWGTSKKGTIPINLLQESATASSSSGGMFSGDEIIIDHPMKLNLQQVNTFLFGNDANNNTDNDDEDDTILDKVYCGASGTAMVLNDGRCFVMGSNKNGELG